MNDDDDDECVHDEASFRQERKTESLTDVCACVCTVVDLRICCNRFDTGIDAESEARNNSRRERHQGRGRARKKGQDHIQVRALARSYV